MNTKTPYRAFTAIAALTLTALSFVQDAQAGDSNEALTKTVTYGDLNLNSPSGAEVLYRRIQTAARQVCSPLDRSDRQLHAAWLSCYDHAIDAAVVKVNSSAVATLRAQSSGHAPTT